MSRRLFVLAEAKREQQSADLWAEFGTVSGPTVSFRILGYYLPAMNVPTLYKGAGPGTYWHRNDARTSGFPLPSKKQPTSNAVVTHITSYSFPSCYLSFSLSFAIARELYAMSGPGGPASKSSPGYVYEIDLSQVSETIPVVNPLEELCKLGLIHRHNGDGDMILAVAGSSHHTLSKRVAASGGRHVSPNMSPELQALVYAVLDAEVLARAVPAACVVNRHSVY